MPNTRRSNRRRNTRRSNNRRVRRNTRRSRRIISNTRRRNNRRNKRGKGDGNQYDIGMVGLGTELAGSGGDFEFDDTNDMLAQWGALEEAEKKLAWMTMTITFFEGKNLDDKKQLIRDIAEMVGLKIK